MTMRRFSKHHGNEFCLFVKFYLYKLFNRNFDWIFDTIKIFERKAEGMIKLFTLKVRNDLINQRGKKIFNLELLKLFFSRKVKSRF